ncbi:hypothetical protein [Acidovorax sp.]|uniref:hypothetical protein n=1 Tax=Acidovorax sp. TaxID=1872122 RepID=UPI00391F7D12
MAYTHQALTAVGVELGRPGHRPAAVEVCIVERALTRQLLLELNKSGATMYAQNMEKQGSALGRTGVTGPCHALLSDRSARRMLEKEVALINRTSFCSSTTGS